MADTQLEIASPQPRATLAPTTFAAAQDFAAYLSKSELVPQAYQGKPANIVVAMQYGMELGLQCLQALQSIAVINGRPTMWGDAMLGLVMANPDYEWHREYNTGEGDNLAGVFEIKRRGQEVHIQTFTLTDAKAAGLAGKSGPWTQYRSRMLKLRARGFALRDKFPDATRGIISREEAEDYQVVEGGSFNQAQQTTQVTTSTPAVITREQAKAFGDAFKANGYAPADAKVWLVANLGVDSTLKIPADKFEFAMQWAKAPKPSNEVEKVEVSHDERIAREAAGILGMDERLIIKEFNRHGDWAATAKAIGDLLP